MLIGLEQEFWVRNEAGDLIFADKAYLPFDECGYLAEARGKPMSSPTEAVYSLMAEVRRMNTLARKYNNSLHDDPTCVIPKALAEEARRRFVKGTVKSNNFYGHTQHRIKQNEGTAGLHISFTNPRQVRGANGEYVTVNAMWDFYSVFSALDKAFMSEIKESRRNPGFYEIKSDGRIEYRSLPANVDFEDVIDVLEGLL